MLSHLDHWNYTETIWRDFYTGTRLDTGTKPYYSRNGDAQYEDTHNCMGAITDGNWDRSWYESKCYVYGNSSCPCSYPSEPLLRLRGLCKKSLIEKNSAKKHFSPMQLPQDPGNMIMVGQTSTRIEYNDLTSQWILKDSVYDVRCV